MEHCEGSAFDRVPDDDSLKITIIEVPIVGGRGNSWGGGGNSWGAGVTALQGKGYVHYVASIEFCGGKLYKQFAIVCFFWYAFNFTLRKKQHNYSKNHN